MARRSSGRSASRPAARPRSPPPRPTPDNSAQHAPPPAPAQSGGGGSMLGGLGSTIAQGMAFGTGSAVAHRAVDSVMGPRTIQHEAVVSDATIAPAALQLPPQQQHPPTVLLALMRAACTPRHSKTSGSEISKCQFYMDMLSECRRNSSEYGLGA